MAGTTGLEPATSAVTGQRSNQLSYVPKKLFQQLGLKSHRIKRFAAFAIFALFYLVVAVDSVLGFVWTPSGHQTGHQDDHCLNEIKNTRTGADLVSTAPGHRKKMRSARRLSLPSGDNR